MLKFSANLGFLWTELSLPEAIFAAKGAGFSAVECHFPYDVAISDVNYALDQTGLKMLSINTRLGVNGVADFGVVARPGREVEARGYIEEAIAYGAAIGCQNVNCVPGKTGGGEEADEVYCRNLRFACNQAAAQGMHILIEPINQRDAPGYHFSTVEKGIEIIKTVGSDNLKLMFDCYHTQITQGDLLTRLQQSLPYIGHVQFAAVPNRDEPNVGEVNYPYLLNELEQLGWDGFFGAEYRPRDDTNAGLAWLDSYRK